MGISAQVKRMEDIFLESLKGDLDKFNEDAFDYLKAEYLPKQDARLPAKFHVSICVTFSGTPENKGVISALEYFSPALNSYACFKSYKANSGGENAATLFDAGIAYFHEWHDRKESILKYLAFMRTNADASQQLKVINAKINNPKVTGYALDRDDVAPKKTAEKVIKELTRYLNLT